MTLLAQSLWLPLAGGAALGLVFGLLPGIGRPVPGQGRLLAALGLGAVLALAIAAVAAIVPGRYGLWLEIAFLLALAYGAGAVVGSGVKRLVSGFRRRAAP